MSTTVWPSRDDYQGAVLYPRRCLKDERLHALKVETGLRVGALCVPSPRSGNFGAVYKFGGDGGPAYALKVFDKSQPDRQQRYRLIHEYLSAGPPSPHLVSFRYDEEGILVCGRWYPTLVMDWAEGRLLDLFLKEVLERNGRLDNGSLCRAWADLVLDLQQRRVAHGDLQHGNILVTAAGRLQLVDYDGMFVPPMRAAGLTAAEIGLPAYQHPRRFRGYFDERLDDFAALVILLSLACLDRDVWRRFHTDDNSLVLREADLLRPDESPLLSALARSPSGRLRKLAALMREVAAGGLDEIPRFPDVVGDRVAGKLLTASWRPPPIVRPADAGSPQGPAGAASRVEAILARPQAPPKERQIRDSRPVADQAAVPGSRPDIPPPLVPPGPPGARRSPRIAWGAAAGIAVLALSLSFWLVRGRQGRTPVGELGGTGPQEFSQGLKGPASRQPGSLPATNNKGLAREGPDLTARKQARREALEAYLNAGRDGADLPASKPEPSDARDWWKLGLKYGNGDGVARDDAAAVRWLRKAAEQGFAPAQNDLGWFYQQGRGVTKDLDVAARWVRKAAEQGDAPAQLHLASLYDKGVGVPRDQAEAMRWYEKAARQGHPPAQTALGLMYLHGRGIAKDPAAAAEWFREAASKGHAPAKRYLAEQYARGEGVPRDEWQALTLTRQAAEQGYAEAQNALGVTYRLGLLGVTRDLAEAARWFRKAAEQGDADAQYSLGWMCAVGQGVPRDDVEAVKWYRTAAEQNFPAATTALGWMYEKGRGVPQDNAEAARLYRKGADLGDPAGQCNVGNICSNHRDYAEALKWYRKAADQNYAPAQYRLGWMYANGQGEPRDDGVAVVWLRMAVRQNHAPAAAYLGWMYEKGRGVPRDNQEAERLYRKAADLGDAGGQRNMGNIYSNRGNNAEAVKWYRKAADQGDQVARERLEALGQSGGGGGSPAAR